METLFLIYLLFINIASFYAMYIDKKKAIKHEYRISEDKLIGLSLIGGSLGMLLGMYRFKHKTHKNKFKLGVPVILIIQMFILT